MGWVYPYVESIGWPGQCMGRVEYGRIGLGWVGLGIFVSVGGLGLLQYWSYVELCW